jgi:hypothetical protein
MPVFEPSATPITLRYVAGTEITRADLRRRLALNALSKPINVVVPAGVAVAAVVIGAWWLWIVAAVVYAVI